MLKNALWLFGITLVILVVFLPSYTKMSDLRRKNAEYDQELLGLKKKSVLLKQEKYLLEKDPDYLEKVAREKMGLVRDGEVIYRLMPANEMVVPAQISPQTPPPTKPKTAPKKK